MFSRVSVLASGPRAGRATTLFLFLFRNLLLASTIVALSRPRTGAHAEDVTSEGINIVLAIDLSSSMLAQDFQPQNRLEVAKDVVKRFINARTSDRIGVVAFAADALTQVPLTTDYPVVNAAVDNLAAGQLEDGTAIGTAIATAANRLRDAPGRSRVMIVLTDGENNRGAIDPRTAAKAAGVFGIKIYTIGVGTEGMAPVPVGRGLFGLRYENRLVRIDEPLLSDIAKMTGGRYFRARDAAAEMVYRLNRIRERIADQEHGYLVSIILDGENAWESYEDNGDPFFRQLYTALSDDPSLRTVTVSEFLRENPPRASLDRLSAGSWINGNFDTWIGEPAQNRAWDLLAQTREALGAWLRNYDLADETVIERAWDELYIAEGSDWYWWYSSHNNSAQNAMYDRLFREHLQNVYTTIGHPVPNEFKQPIRKEGEPERQRGITALIHPDLQAAEHAGAATTTNGSGTDNSSPRRTSICKVSSTGRS